MEQVLNIKPLLKIKRLYNDTRIPVRAHPGDSGADVFAHNIKRLYFTGEGRELCIESLVALSDNIDNSDNSDFKKYYPPALYPTVLHFPLALEPGDRALVGTGIAATVGKGYEIQARSRSGIPLKVGVIVGNSPGTIDEPFRAEIGIILINTSNFLQTFEKGDRIAQIVVAPVIIPDMVIVEELDETDRGDGGFGSTGT
jgi:dUTP pyrophosphatase